MTATRAVVLVMVILVAFGFVLAAIQGPAAGAGATPAGTATPSATPTPAVAKDGRPVVRSLAAVQRAFNAGDVAALCRPGDLVDPAVVRQLNRQPGGCESELEGLIANEPPLRMTVERVALERDLATVSVKLRSGATASVDVVRSGRKWLVSFSDGNDPIATLAGTD